MATCATCSGELQPEWRFCVFCGTAVTPAAVDEAAAEAPPRVNPIAIIALVLACIGGIPGKYVYLVEKSGSPADLVARFGTRALPYSAHVTPAGLERLAAHVDGVSVDKAMLLRTDASASAIGTTDLVDRIHAAGLLAYTWTLRAENTFLARNFRRGSSKRDFGDWREEFRLILGTGVDGVFADQPDLVLDALAAG